MSRNKNKTFRTVKIPVVYETTEDRDMIVTYQRQQTHIVRSVFKKEEKGLPYDFKSFNHYNDIDLLDSWWKQSAVYEGKAKYDSKKEIELAENRNIRVCFGGKQTMNDYREGEITKEELRIKRLNPLVSIGERDSGTKRTRGNRKFKMADDLSSVEIKLKERTIKAKLCADLHTNYKDIVKILLSHQQSGDIPITYKIDSEYLYISYANEDLKECIVNNVLIPNRIFAIDMNPNYIGWSVVQWHDHGKFEIIDAGVISMKELNDKENKLIKEKVKKTDKQRTDITKERKTEIYHISNFLMTIALHNSCSAYGFEKLDIKSEEHDKGKIFNRLINNQWLRKPLVDNIKKRCVLSGMKPIEVLPEYSSFVGNFLFRSLNLSLPDMCLASIEIGRRAYEFNHQHILKDVLPMKNIIFPRLYDFRNLFERSVEEFNIQAKNDSLKKIYKWFKNDPKVTYRVSLDSTNPEFLTLKSSKFYAKKCSFKKNILAQFVT